VSDELIGPDESCVVSGPLDDALAAIDAIEASPAEAWRIESTGVTRADVSDMAKAGVLSAGVGETMSAPQVREVHERLAAASGALWFVMAQHRSPTEAARSTASAALRDRYAAGLSTGKLLGAVSFAHLRRPRPTVIATRGSGGWEISGRLDWITSWGLADVLLLMAESPDGEVVQALLPSVVRPGLSVGNELPLAAMRGTSTVSAVLEQLRVSDDEVAAVLPKPEWLKADEHRTANAVPVVFGLARAAVNALADLAEGRGWTIASDAAARIGADVTDVRRRAYQLIDEVDPAEQLSERRELRARSTGLAATAVSALTVAQGGRSMLESSRESRWAREVQFALVQAQTHATREAWLSEVCR